MMNLKDLAVQLFVCSEALCDLESVDKHYVPAAVDVEGEELVNQLEDLFLHVGVLCL